MRDIQTIDGLIDEIVKDEDRYGAMFRSEREIVTSTSHLGFADACRRVQLVAEIQNLSERLRKNKLLAAWSKR